MLSPDRLERFARHIVLPEIGGAGQVALANAHVAPICEDHGPRPVMSPAAEASGVEPGRSDAGAAAPNAHA